MQENDFIYEEIISSPPPDSLKKSKKKTEPKLSRYMIDTRKHYYLASNTDSIESYMQQQINELTNILINYKFQYDNIIRQRIKKKEDSIEIEKKIEMLKKVDNKIQRQLNRAKSQNDIIKSNVAYKKEQKDELLYEKKTLKNLISKIRNDIYVINKQTSLLDKKTESLEKNYFKEKINEKDVMLETNKVYNQILEQNKKNAYEKNEQDLTIKFYNTIIEQKSDFLKGNEIREIQQKKIEEKQSKENTDKIEIEGRKVLLLSKLYNKFLKIKMNKLLRKYSGMEKCYEKIRNIYGTSDLNFIVDEMLNREKNYQLKIKEVKELEKKLEDLKNTIKNKEENIKIFSQKCGTLIDEEIINSKKLEEDEKLINKEKELENKLKNLKELNEIISVKYNNMKSNIVKICKDYNKYFQNKETAQTNLITNNELDELTLETKNSTIEDNLIENNYYEFLKNLDKKIEGLFLCHSKKEFLQIMRQKGNKINPILEDNFKKISKNFKNDLFPKKLYRENSDIMLSSSSCSTNRNCMIDKKKLNTNNFFKEKQIQNNIFNHFLKGYKQKLIEETGVDTEKHKIIRKKI